MQLLKITTVPIKYREQENVTVDPASSSFEMNLEKNMSNVKIPVAGSEKSQTPPEKMKDQSSFRMNGVQKNRTDSMAHEAGQTVSENDYDVKYCYGKKNAAPAEIKKTAAVSYMNNSSYASVSMDAAIDGIDSVLPDASWEPDVAAHKEDGQNAVHVHHSTIKEPQTRKVVEEFAHVEIEYLGGFNYVPKSSDPDYVDPEEE